MMRSSMIKPAQTQDKELLYEIGEMVKTLARFPEVKETMYKYAEHYQTLEHKVKTHDYTKENEILTRSIDAIK